MRVRRNFWLDHWGEPADSFSVAVAKYQVIPAETLGEHALVAHVSFLIHAELCMGWDLDQPKEGYRFHDAYYGGQ